MNLNKIQLEAARRYIELKRKELEDQMHLLGFIESDGDKIIESS